MEHVSTWSMCAARDLIWSGEATAIRRHRGIVVFEGGRFGRRKADGLWQNIGGAQPFRTGCCLLRVLCQCGSLNPPGQWPQFSLSRSTGGSECLERHHSRE